MPVPSSGQLRLRADINLEVNGNDTDDNVSLGTLSNEAGFTEPDTMSEFYGYQACTAPSSSINPTGASFSIGGTLDAYAFLRNTNGCNVTDCGLYVGTSSNIANATKHSLYSSWNLYTYRYFQLTGYTANTTYYVWIYATNDGGTMTYSHGALTVPPPYMNATFVNARGFGDYNYYCPDSSWYGGMIMNYTGNSPSLSLTFDVYGGSTFSHTGSANCLKNYGTYTDFSRGDTYFPMEGTSGVPPNCTRSGSSGTTDNLYIKMIASGYSSRIATQSTTCT